MRPVSHLRDASNHDSAEAAELVADLKREIVRGPTTSRALERWCRDRGLDDDPQIVADVSPTPPAPLTPEEREWLGVTRREILACRRVQLRCGSLLLVDADNWYVASRLTPDMNERLRATRIPFGRVVEPFGPYRCTMSSTTFWPGAIEQALFHVQAVVYADRHVPLAVVRESYRRELLGIRAGGQEPPSVVPFTRGRRDAGIVVQTSATATLKPTA